MANDTFVQTLKRFVFSESYWQDKVEKMKNRMLAQQKRFKESHLIYHNKLQQRRDAVRKATQAIANGKESGAKLSKLKKAARREVIQTFRVTLKPLREETRKQGKELRRTMELLMQAERAWQNSRW